MEYRPYYLAREWVRAGHRGAIVGGRRSRTCAAAPAGRAGATQIGSTASPTAGSPTPRVPAATASAALRNIAAFLRAACGATRARARCASSRPTWSSPPAPTRWTSGSARRIARLARGAKLVLRGARPVAAVADRAVGHVAAPPVHRCCARRPRTTPTATPTSWCRCCPRCTTTWPRTGWTCASCTSCPTASRPTNGSAAPQPLRADVAAAIDCGARAGQHGGRLCRLDGPAQCAGHAARRRRAAARRADRLRAGRRRPRARAAGAARRGREACTT